MWGEEERTGILIDFLDAAVCSSYRASFRILFWGVVILLEEILEDGIFAPYGYTKRLVVYNYISARIVGL